MGDLNAKMGEENKNKELIMGKYGIGNSNENGELFADFCTFNDLVILEVPSFYIKRSIKQHGFRQTEK